MIGSWENYLDRIGINLPGKPEEGESPSSQKLWYQPGRTSVSFFDAHFHPVILDHHGYLRLHLCELIGQDEIKAKFHHPAFSVLAGES